MNGYDVLKAWGRILRGHYPCLSIEITRECPLSCPGCYAYEAEHLYPVEPFQSFTEYKGQSLVDGVLDLVQRYRPLHLSIVGGEPLVRYRELDVLLPGLSDMGIPVQIVTSAVRKISETWARISNLYIIVSIDGLQSEHDARRKPATYDRILENIKGHSITVHCTVTSHMTHQDNYFERFLSFWSKRPETNRVWFSLFTPQRNSQVEEILSPNERLEVLKELSMLRTRYPKLDLSDQVIEGYNNPPTSPENCIFAQTTLSLGSDLKSVITPCQFGGIPDCSQCGCMGSASFKAHSIFALSHWFGQSINRFFLVSRE
ncbi:MAG: radical SAM protein [Planctomycetota bacterium]|jgi:MoaA/NifB/PqqE/SkfB family radical SAM enzyme